jgi:hypothetical protein
VTPGRVRWGRRALAAVAWLFVAGVMAQMLWAGRAIFVGPQWWVRHRDFVHAFEWLAPLAVVLAYVARAARATKWLAWVTVALLFLQYTTAGFRARDPRWAALHTVTAGLLVWASIDLAVRATREVRMGDRERA